MNHMAERPVTPANRAMDVRCPRARGNGRMVLICYDGSADAQAAIDGAGQLMPGSDATVT